MTVADQLKKFFSEEALAAAKKYVREQMALGATGTAAAEKATENLVEFIEKLDDAVVFIPRFGPLVKLAMDTPLVDAQQRQLAAALIEFAYQLLKDEPVGVGPVVNAPELQSGVVE
ncbi:hypothetical protein [Deinococcus peraridilitoris]|uniref:Uncharacterized protein n=1 Tax=Deinococcus peraridilitoris (strain DSM 19664 / LMG 22246 / CIP 109416 / KR-200) TaxID=937777 RepID=K9ZWM8_DEIPD|nr:hypothetical protein [Deinococcus peraridilitoris]AFZ66053.1 hypothetical protein Deipe_0457 [Deinococcus peraridilitoris DSM 19664]